MLLKLHFLFAFAIISQVFAGIANPRDIIDEAKEELDQLRSIVQGSIFSTHNRLSSLNGDFLTVGENVRATTVIAIQQAHQTYDAELQTIKDLAHSANKDISSCTNIREDLLNTLPEEYGSSLRRCIYEENRREAQLLLDATYIIDTYMTNVRSLEFRINACREDILCISPLLTEINLDKIRLPQKIETEYLAFSSMVDNLQVSIQGCADTNESGYLGEASAILQDITDCANAIIG